MTMTGTSAENPHGSSTPGSHHSSLKLPVNELSFETSVRSRALPVLRAALPLTVGDHLPYQHRQQLVWAPVCSRGHVPHNLHHLNCVAREVNALRFR